MTETLLHRKIACWSGLMLRHSETQKDLEGAEDVTHLGQAGRCQSCMPPARWNKDSLDSGSKTLKPLSGPPRLCQAGPCSCGLGLRRLGTRWLTVFVVAVVPVTGSSGCCVLLLRCFNAVYCNSCQHLT